MHCEGDRANGSRRDGVSRILKRLMWCCVRVTGLVCVRHGKDDVAKGTNLEARKEINNEAKEVTNSACGDYIVKLSLHWMPPDDFTEYQPPASPVRTCKCKQESGKPTRLIDVHARKSRVRYTRSAGTMLSRNGW